MLASTRTLLADIVDYAGTFPPAGLPLADALSNYARDRRSPEAWLLGRLVLAGSSLPEFERLAPPLLSSGPLPWKVSLILGSDPVHHVEHVHAFNETWRGRATIVSVEFAPGKPTEIRQLKDRVPEAVEAFFETPIDAALEPRLAAIAEAGAFAKVRAGGTTAGVVPTPAGLVRFMEGCSDAGIAFKATAGLHHAMRNCYPLTYETNSPTDTMHGFLNLSVAAALVSVGADTSAAVDALVESTPAFEFREDSIIWRDTTLTLNDISDTRRLLFRSFGSCAFREPVEELARLRLL